MPRPPRKGTITQLDARGFGFIKHAGGGVRYVFDRAAVEGVAFEDLHVGQAVTFTEGDGIRGPRAVKVGVE